LSLYLLLKWLHVTTALVSLGLFSLRFVLTITSRPWRSTWLRWGPHVNDSVLLAAAVGLCVVTGWTPLVHHWLTVKILLLLGYILSGREALKPDNSRFRQCVFAVIALALVLSIFGVALMKPW
jgi:uncharacterized membrane protein SirB2